MFQWNISGYLCYDYKLIMHFNMLYLYLSNLNYIDLCGFYAYGIVG